MLDRVPYEVFSKIIKYLYRYYSHQTSSFDFYETTLPPIKATHVCHSWRATLLSDPSMWTCIRLDFTEIKLDELNAMLSRSGSAPLDVFVEQTGISFDPYLFFDAIGTLPHVFQEMHRFRTLQILMRAEMAGIVLNFLIRQPAPMLQMFYLELRGNESNEREWAVFQEAHKNLFLGNAPNLKRLYLQISAGLKELQHFSLFKNLSKLHLQFVSCTTVDGDILLGVLHSSPGLRILSIIWPYLRPKIICSTPSHRRISLPCLQELSLRGGCGVDLVDIVLGHLDFPIVNVKFDITCNNSIPVVSDSTTLFRFLAQRRLSLLSISDGSLGETSIELFERMNPAFPMSNLHFKEGSVLRLTYEHYAPPGHPALLSDFLQKFKMSDITHMCLEDISSEPGMLRSIFVLLENLQHLRVRHVCWDKDNSSLQSSSLLRLYLKSLTPQSDASPESEIDGRTQYLTNNEIGQSYTLPCPSLRTLELVFSQGFMEFKEPDIQALNQCFNARKHAGYPFQSIIIWCTSLVMVDRAKAWLHTLKFEGLHTEVLITSA